LLRQPRYRRATPIKECPPRFDGSVPSTTTKSTAPCQPCRRTRPPRRLDRECAARRRVRSRARDEV